ncbi:hypothetical protein [Coraliomargarita parva]|uniref:hypothetical protein n=1 Tax=Coraliomargarita parva TaxID=3014050 RepID=UPI0022B2B842|nr:hypothetical protein [Coraliomargarita parva]
MRSISLLLLLGFLPLVALANNDELSDAKLAAERYRSSAASLEAKVDALGKKHMSILDPDSEDAVPVSQEERTQYKESLGEILKEIRDLQSIQSVNWSKAANSDVPDIWENLSESFSIRKLSRNAVWYAEQTWKENQSEALDALFTGWSAARHRNQAPNLMTGLVDIAASNICLRQLAKFAPEMTSEERKQTLTRIHSLPPTSRLSNAILSDRDGFSGLLLAKLESAMADWEAEHLGKDGFRFPSDLRLAGIMQLPEAAPKISLRNMRSQQSFWLSENQDAYEIHLERIDLTKHKAWLRYKDRTAVINLQHETIESRYVPWEVIIKVFAGLSYSEQSSQEKQIEALREMGLTPENVLDQLEMHYRFYDALVERIDQPIAEIRKFQSNYIKGYDEDSFIGMTLDVHYDHIIETSRIVEQKQEALRLGFELLDGSRTITEGPLTYNGHTYQVRETGTGFQIELTGFEERSREENPITTLLFEPQI